MDKIVEFIDNVERMTTIRKDFYKKILKIRYDELKKVFETL